MGADKEQNPHFSEQSQEIVRPFNGVVFDVEVHRILDQDNKTARREIVRHSGGACVIAVDQDLQVAMVRQYRKALERVTWEIPAGKLDRGESPLDCARRELKEETGLTARRLEKILTLNPSPGYCSETLHIFLATELTRGTPRPDDGENLTVNWLDLAQLLEMVYNDEINDAKTVTALLLAAKLLADDFSGEQNGAQKGR